jgi:hypothetical protein
VTTLLAEKMFTNYNSAFLRQHTINQYLLKTIIIPQTQPRTAGFLKTKASDASWHP